jgi:hypothetical protein
MDVVICPTDRQPPQLIRFCEFVGKGLIARLDIERNVLHVDKNDKLSDINKQRVLIVLAGSSTPPRKDWGPVTSRPPNSHPREPLHFRGERVNIVSPGLHVKVERLNQSNDFSLTARATTTSNIRCVR